MARDKEKEAWIAGVHSADRIFRETIREAKNSLAPAGFLRWLDGFVKEDEKADEKTKVRKQEDRD